MFARLGDRFRSTATPQERFWEKVLKGDGCWIWTAVRQGNGYGGFGIAGSVKRTAHRVSWEFANGPIPPGLCVLHRCDNRLCVRPDHLFLGTHADNMADMAAKGRWKLSEKHPHRGSRHSQAKLTEQQATEIKSLRWRSVAVEVARRYGINVSTVYRLWNGSAWPHIPLEVQP